VDTLSFLLLGLVGAVALLLLLETISGRTRRPW
jgi:hypothetical protein